MGGGVEPNGEAYFSDPAQAHNRDRAGSGSTRPTTSSSVESRPRLHEHSTSSATVTSSGANANMDTPMPMKRGSSGLLHFYTTPQISTPSREGEAKELREFWKAYMHTPLSDTGGDSTKGTPLAAAGSGGGYRKRVASMPTSKTPIVERDMGDMGMMYGPGGGGGEQSLIYPMRAGLHGPGAAGQQHGNTQREDLRSYEAAVMARKAPTTLNLKPRMVKGRGGHVNVRSHSFLAFRFFSLDSYIYVIAARSQCFGSKSTTVPLRLIILTRKPTVCGSELT